MQKEAEWYSASCKTPKTKPNVTAKPNKDIEVRISEDRRQECDQVSSKPENNKMKVFSRGMAVQGIGIMPAGGQRDPSSGEGERAE